MVWKAGTKLGIGFAKRKLPKSMIINGNPFGSSYCLFVVGRYKPHGNIEYRNDKFLSFFTTFRIKIHDRRRKTVLPSREVETINLTMIRPLHLLLEKKAILLKKPAPPPPPKKKGNSTIIMLELCFGKI